MTPDTVDGATLQACTVLGLPWESFKAVLEVALFTSIDAAALAQSYTEQGDAAVPPEAVSRLLRIFAMTLSIPQVQEVLKTSAGIVFDKVDAQVRKHMHALLAHFGLAQRFPGLGEFLAGVFLQDGPAQLLKLADEVRQYPHATVRVHRELKASLRGHRLARLTNASSLTSSEAWTATRRSVGFVQPRPCNAVQASWVLRRVQSGHGKPLTSETRLS